MTQPLFPWLEANPTLIGVIIVPLAAGIIGHIVSRTGTISERDKLADPDSRGRAIARYRTKGYPAYIAALTRLTGWADTFYGPRLLGAQSFTRCLQIAFLYPLVALLMGWVLFDVGELGGFPMLEEGRSFPDRLWRLGVMLTGWAIAYWFLRNLDSLDDWVIDRLDRYLPITTPRASFRTKLARGVVIGKYLSSRSITQASRLSRFRKNQ